MALLSEIVPPGALLALDLGVVRVGVAACGPERILAHPVGTIPAEGWVDHVGEIVEERRVVAIMVGYPLDLSGREGIAAGKVARQAEELARKLGISVWLVDERMTTAEAHSRLRETGRTAKTARSVVDAQAAVGILESVLRALEQGHIIGHRLEVG